MNDLKAEIQTSSVDETRRFGERLGAALRPGDVVGLIGPLGAGKTALVQGVAVGAGVPDRRQVNSPTFVIVNEYTGRSDGGALRLFHIDAYRLRGPDDLAALGLDEMIEHGVVLIEWADRVGAVLPQERLTVEIEPTGPTTRTLKLMATGALADRIGVLV